MTESWAIGIDIEGFSAHFCHGEEGKSYAIRGLRKLVGAISRIGHNCYPPDSPEQAVPKRLFAYQYGDGFLVALDPPESDTSRPIAIATALMRHMIMAG